MPVYIIRHKDGNKAIVYTSTDANDAINYSMDLIKDQYGHDLEMWIGSKKVSTIDIVL